MPRCRENNWTKTGWYPVRFASRSLNHGGSIRCWRVPLAGSQVNAFLLRRLCPCRRVKPQPFSVGVGLRQWCVLSPLLFIFYIRVLHTMAAGLIRPAKPFRPATKHIFPIMRKWYIYEKCVDLVEWNISRKNHITQDVRPSNSCAIAYVVHSQKIWRVLVYTNWMIVTDASTRVSLLGIAGWTICFLRMNWYQASNQLGTPREAKSFLRGTHIFWTMSNTFFQGGRKII